MATDRYKDREMKDPFYTTYNGVPFCDLSAFDQEQVNNGIIPPDAEIGINQRALIKELVDECPYQSCIPEAWHNRAIAIIKDQYDTIKVLQGAIDMLEGERADAVQSLLAIGIRQGADPGILALAYKLRGY